MEYKGLLEEFYIKLLLILKVKVLKEFWLLDGKHLNYSLNQVSVLKKIFPFSYFIGPYKNTKPNDHIKNDKFRFIYVGSLVSNKNLDLLIKALSLLKSYKFELIVIGDGPKKKAWKNYADELIPNRSFLKRSLQNV